MSRLKLTDYGISMKSGFVLEDPLTKLPPYFDPWNTMASNLVELCENNTLREKVVKMPVLDINKLNGEKEIKLGYLQLGTITSCYLFYKGVDPADVPKSLPRSLAIPLYGLYEKHDLAPILSYASSFLSSCVVLDPNSPVTAENLSTMCNLPVDEDWNWFVTIMVETEYTFAKSMQAIQNVLDSVDENDEEKMTRSLEEIAETVRSVKKVHSRIHKKVPLESFIAKLSQYFSGYDSGSLENGLVFEGVQEEPIKMAGANAGHGPFFKSLDALLGVDHKNDIGDYTESNIMLMFPNHRNFIYELRKRPLQLRTVVERSKNNELKNAFDNVVQAIVEFRSYHIQLVTKYVFIAMNRILPKDNLESVKPFKEFVRDYLKGMRDDTKRGTIKSDAI